MMARNATRPRCRRRLALSLGALLPVLALVVSAALLPLPESLLHGRPPSVRVLDRHRRLIREIRTEDGKLAGEVTVDDVAPSLIDAMIAAEDARFRWHPGVDPLAIARALGQLVWHRRVVSGASTITQQLARALVPRPRSLAGKWREMSLALRIEASLDKRQILEAYLNQVEFGPRIRGVEAASRHYFDKPPNALSLAEAATLAAIPRGPTLYDPARGTQLVERRRNRILDRLLAHDPSRREAIALARAEPIRLQAGKAEGGAHHLVRALTRGQLPSQLWEIPKLRRVESSLDIALEHEVEGLVARAAPQLAAHGASTAAVLVVDTTSGEVLAHVGSSDFFGAAILGQNDGVLARRQPGSALKPFVYAAAMQELGLTAASSLPDVELHLATPQGDYSPQNYDRLYHGPVRLREALASSLNVPAVVAAKRTGPARVLRLLREFGFASLERDAEHYGAALALGDGEVTLAELAAAYAALARGGLYRPLSFVRAAESAEGGRIDFALAPARRVLDGRLAAILTDILADADARSSAFGRGSALELPFPAAAKTGTSKGYRDNWAVGYTREVTVAVWVGNFDGRPMVDSSGVTGAGPLFRDTLLAAMRGRQPKPLVDRAGLVETEVCARGGERAHDACPERVRELFLPERPPESGPAILGRVWVDAENGRLAKRGCPGAEERLFERYPPALLGWAKAAGRPLAPTEASPRCPGAATGRDTVRPRIEYPFDGARFVLDQSLGREQEILVLRARAPAGERVRLLVDGQIVGTSQEPVQVLWRLARGEHQLVAQGERGSASETVRFSVR